MYPSTITLQGLVVERRTGTKRDEADVNLYNANSTRVAAQIALHYGKYSGPRPGTLLDIEIKERPRG